MLKEFEVAPGITITEVDCETDVEFDSLNHSEKWEVRRADPDQILNRDIWEARMIGPTIQ